jgi:hypothetical protein
MPFWRSGAAFALAIGACAVLAGAACSQSYAEDAKPDGATPDAAAADDAPVDADVAADAAADVAPKPTTFTELASGLMDLGGVAADETTVYVTERGPGNVKSLPIGGGAVATLSASTGAPGPIVLADGFVFWGDVGALKLARMATAGGAISSTPTGTGKAPHAIAAAADRIVVVTVAAGGGGEVQQYLFDLTAGPVVSGLSNPFAVAVVGSDIYWTESSGSRIGKGSVGAAFNTTVSNGEPGCESITANAAAIYWTRDDGSVQSAAGGSGAAGVTALTTGEVGPLSVTADDTDVYWLTSNGTLRRKTIGQELPPATLAKDFASAFVDRRVRAIALTSKYVVWITTDGRVLRTDK